MVKTSYLTIMTGQLARLAQPNYGTGLLPVQI